MDERICMNCSTTTTRLDNRNCEQWYKVIKEGKIIGYHCAKCYDKIRRLPLFQNFKEKLSQRLCSNCGNKTLTTFTKKGYTHQRWYDNYKGGWWCQSCWSLTRFLYKGKTFHSDTPRKGICQNCGKSTHNQEIRRTNLHHIKYDDNKPLSNTIELCIACHRKIHTIGLGG